jgi:hypothetical protein
MPIMVLFRSPRVDRTLYDAIMQELDVEQSPPAGSLTHACGFDDKGICVVDVWESRKDFEAFLTDRLTPTFAKLNIDFVAPEIIDGYAFRASEEVDRYVRERGPDLRAAGQAAAPRGRQPAH